jgi:TRAP-type mannitol/chloroaromatic compound transport system permease small subunit
MNVLKTFSRWIDTLNEWVGRGVGWVTLGLVVVVFADVLMRYIFDNAVFPT